MSNRISIQSISISGSTLNFMVDGKFYQFELDKISQKLKLATIEQRNFYKVSPSGYGLHWPLIDEDISLFQLVNAK